MTRTTRVLFLSLQTVAITWWLGAAGCSSSNEPSTTPTTATGTGTGTGTGGAGGATGGNTTGGNTSGTGGSSGSGTGTGGGAGSGMAGSGGGGAQDFTPLCSAVGMTAAGMTPAKGGACTPSDPQKCWGTCGPSSIGFKSETCTGGIYVEQSGCSFKSGQDFSCYKIPATISSTCPASVPQASSACTVAPCTPCNFMGNYADSGGAQKEGFCVCPMPNAAGMAKWTCASTTAWPCPGGQGC